MYIEPKNPKIKKLLPKEVLVYIEEIAKKYGKEAYFPTNMLRTKLKKERGIWHCWTTYQTKLKTLEKQGKIESIDTVWGKMWRLKSGE